MSDDRPYSCILIDDDPTTVLILENYIAQIPKLRLKASFTDPFLALIHMEQSDDVDFLFLDIKMKISGIDVAKKLRGKVRYLTFVTAYKEFALDAFNVECDQYLVKPITFTKFLATVNQLIKTNNRQSKMKNINS